MSPPAILKPGTPNFSTCLLPLSTVHKLNQLQFHNLPFKFPRNTYRSIFRPHSVQTLQPHFSFQDEEHVIGDCVVFEEGIFEDPYAQKPFNSEIELDNDEEGKSTTEVEPENLIPGEWADVQREINITNHERRVIAQQLEVGQRVEKKRLALRPIGNDSTASDGVNFEEYLKSREEKLKQLKQRVLHNPKFDEVKKAPNRELNRIEQETSISGVSSGRVSPKNPSVALRGRGLEDIAEFFNSGIYEANVANKFEGPRKLFTKEEKALLNKRSPNLAPATSEKWQPLHTLAASGEFYHITSLLNHIVDINVTDNDGLTAIHKAILGKKQAIFNLLLRESANPFIRDKDGATLMHYAVRRASSQMIKILLLYNVDINLHDHDGWTPLHLAVQSRRTDIVRLLLMKGADKTLRNRDGLTPLDICLHCGRDTRTYELIKLLKLLPRFVS